MIQGEIEFWNRFYSWSLADWQREINQGFPFYKSFNDNSLYETFKELCDAEVKDFIAAMVKRSLRSDLLERMGLTIDDKDRYYADLYIKKWRTSLLVDPLYKKYERASEDEIELAQFKKVINSSLFPVLGVESTDVNCWQSWQYVNAIGPWKVRTVVEIGNIHQQLSYNHSIFCNKDNYLLENYSFLRWLGISAGTDWYGLTNADVPCIAKTLANMVNHFIQAVTVLLVDVKPLSNSQRWDKQ